ncbi:hypothetical protein EXN66_Car005090 [Channa argus]|uniref:Uncharacterized protein n=1 Tax=Channa argus TaxID=215402 RepID=A0A6G1PHE3_CHAAH|nr:hypothetical protein EXN66_Car005090 [Channa argus]
MFSSACISALRNIRYKGHFGLISQQVIFTFTSKITSILLSPPHRQGEQSSWYILSESRTRAVHCTTDGPSFTVQCIRKQSKAPTAIWVEQNQEHCLNPGIQEFHLQISSNLACVDHTYNILLLDDTA